MDWNIAARMFTVFFLNEYLKIVNVKWIKQQLQLILFNPVIEIVERKDRTNPLWPHGGNRVEVSGLRREFMLFSGQFVGSDGSRTPNP